MSGWDAAASNFSHRASSGTQNTFLADVFVAVLQDLGDLLGILDVAVTVWVAEFRLQFATAQLE